MPGTKIDINKEVDTVVSSKVEDGVHKVAGVDSNKVVAGEVSSKAEDGVARAASKEAAGEANSKVVGEDNNKEDGEDSSKVEVGAANNKAEAGEDSKAMVAMREILVETLPTILEIQVVSKLGAITIKATTGFNTNSSNNPST